MILLSLLISNEGISTPRLLVESEIKVSLSTTLHHLNGHWNYN